MSSSPVPAEGHSHPLPGAGAGESQGGAGYQKQTAPPAGEEADGGGQTGESRIQNEHTRTGTHTHICAHLYLSCLFVLFLPDGKKCEVG